LTTLSSTTTHSTRQRSLAWLYTESGSRNDVRRPNDLDSLPDGHWPDVLSIEGRIRPVHSFTLDQISSGNVTLPQAPFTL